MGKFLGKLAFLPLQLHNGIGVYMENTHVAEVEPDITNFIIRTDLLRPVGDVIREYASNMDVKTSKMKLLRLLGRFQGIFKLILECIGSTVAWVIEFNEDEFVIYVHIALPAGKEAVVYLYEDYIIVDDWLKQIGFDSFRILYAMHGVLRCGIPCGSVECR